MLNNNHRFPVKLLKIRSCRAYFLQWHRIQNFIFSFLSLRPRLIYTVPNTCCWHVVLRVVDYYSHIDSSMWTIVCLNNNYTTKIKRKNAFSLNILTVSQRVVYVSVCFIAKRFVSSCCERTKTRRYLCAIRKANSKFNLYVQKIPKT